MKKLPLVARVTQDTHLFPEKNYKINLGYLLHQLEGHLPYITNVSLEQIGRDTGSLF